MREMHYGGSNARRNKSVTIIFDGIPLVVDKKTTYKELLHKYMIQSSKEFQTMKVKRNRKKV